MKRTAAVLTAAALAWAALGGHALAAGASSIPPKFSIPFASSAPTTTPGGTAGGATYPLPTPSQIGTTNCAASLTDGFPAKTMQSVASGGCAPFGQDLNGILKQVSFWNQWQAMGGPVPYDGTFSTAIGGYPQGALVASSTTLGSYWLSLVDNNTSNPDTGGANWQGLGVGVPIGTLMPFAGATAPTGYLLANGQAVSRTTYAFLFTVIGTTYGSGDGSTTFNVPDLRGRVPAGNDTMSASAANRLTSAGSGCAGSTTGTGCGAQNQTIAQTNLPNVNFNVSGISLNDPGHVHGISPTAATFGCCVSGGSGNGLANSGASVTQSATTGITINNTAGVQGAAASGGSGTALPTVQPTLVANYIIKY